MYIERAESDSIYSFSFLAGPKVDFVYFWVQEAWKGDM